MPLTYRSKRDRIVFPQNQNLFQSSAGQNPKRKYCFLFFSQSKNEKQNLESKSKRDPFLTCFLSTSRSSVPKQLPSDSFEILLQDLQSFQEILTSPIDLEILTQSGDIATITTTINIVPWEVGSNYHDHIFTIITIITTIIIIVPREVGSTPLVNTFSSVGVA